MVPAGMPAQTQQGPQIQVGTPQQIQQPQQQQQPQQPAGPLYTDEDVQQVQEMFPDVDAEVIKSLLDANRGSKDATINNLLSMAS